jgi:hypothetical protein
MDAVVRRLLVAGEGKRRKSGFAVRSIAGVDQGWMGEIGRARWT